MKIYHRSEFIIAAVLLASMLVIGLINPAFWHPDNLFNLLRNNIVIGIMAMGVLLIMISGGIDVSFPAFAVAGMYLSVKLVIALEYQGVILPIACAVLIGGALGLVNGFFVSRFKLIPLIVTLGKENDKFIYKYNKWYNCSYSSLHNYASSFYRRIYYKAYIFKKKYS